MTNDIEKATLLDKATVRTRPVRPDDARAIAALDEHTVRSSVGATRDAPSSLAEVESYIKSLEKAGPPELIYLVAEKADFQLLVPDARGTQARDDDKGFYCSLLGYIVLAPYTGSYRTPRSCFARTASMYVTVWDDTAIGSELDGAVKMALVEDAIAKAQENGYSNIVFDTATRQHESASADTIKTYLDMGFQQAGLLRGIMEKGGQVLDRVLLQKPL